MSLREWVVQNPAAGAMTAATKHDGPRNWNHLMLLYTHDDLVERSLVWRLTHLETWLQIAVSHYAMWSSPTFVHPYNGRILGPGTAPYRAYAASIARWFFADIRPGIERTWPSLKLTHEWRGGYASAKVPYTIYGVVVLPLIMILSAVRIVRTRRRGGWRSAAFVFVCFLVLWSLVAACLTDGIEGNRMRFATIPPLFILIAIWLVNDPCIARRRTPWWRPRGSATVRAHSLGIP
jgi:hypothetical protein